jgi:hypothetical protein
MKLKLIISLDENHVQQLRARALVLQLTMDQLIEDAVRSYLLRGDRRRDQRRAAVARFCSRPFGISTAEVREIMEQDPYDQ